MINNQFRNYDHFTKRWQYSSCFHMQVESLKERLDQTQSQLVKMHESNIDLKSRLQKETAQVCYISMILGHCDVHILSRICGRGEGEELISLSRCVNIKTFLERWGSSNLSWNSSCLKVQGAIFKTENVWVESLILQSPVVIWYTILFWEVLSAFGNTRKEVAI